MKSAYELAMERLTKTAPTVKLSEAQKKQMAELDSQYAAKIAAREIACWGWIKTGGIVGSKQEFYQFRFFVLACGGWSDFKSQRSKQDTALRKRNRSG